jgi:GPH family glycoside/pentoside/hexuronide:cation symporter
MSTPVPLLTRVAYASPAFALAVVGIPVYVYLPKFYTDVVGVPIAVVGAILLAVRIFDAVTDPMIGALSDRTRTRFGRRRPWIAGASLPLALAIALLFVPPETDPRMAGIWFGVSVFALFLFWTAVVVPYESLGPEITFDYDERTSLLGLRDGVLIAGTLVAATSPAAVAWWFGLGDDPVGERAKFAWIAAIYIPLLLLLCGGCALAVPERARSGDAPLAGLWDDLRTMLRNRPFGILLASYTISAFGNNLPATLILYYVQYVLGSARADLFLLLYFVTGIVFLPGWVALSRRIGKKEAWLSAMAINTGAFFAVFFLGPGDAGLYGVLVVLSGVGFGATLAIPSAMQADVIDYDELLSGERREGQYIGVWSVAKKLAAALGVGAALSILGVAGYQPNVEQTPQVQFTLRVLYAFVPCVCNLIAMGVAFVYPIDRARHGRILEAVEARRIGRSVLDPLRPGQELAGAS